MGQIELFSNIHLTKVKKEINLVYPMSQKARIAKLISKHKEVASLVKEVERDLKKHGGSLYLMERPSSATDYEFFDVSGVFSLLDKGDKEIPQVHIYDIDKTYHFVPGLVHEWCHLRQWEKGLRFYSSIPNNPTDVYFTVRMEWDAERATVREVKKRGLKKYYRKGEPHYIRATNLHLYGMAHAVHNGMYFEFNFDDPEVLGITKQMPSKFPDDPYWYFCPPQIVKDYLQKYSS